MGVPWSTSAWMDWLHKSTMERHMNYQNAWGSKTQSRKRGRGPKPHSSHDPWEYNTIPWADREWMKQNQSDLDKAALSRSITGGSDNDNEEG